MKQPPRSKHNQPDKGSPQKSSPTCFTNQNEWKINLFQITEPSVLKQQLVKLWQICDKRILDCMNLSALLLRIWSEGVSESNPGSFFRSLARSLNLWFDSFVRRPQRWSTNINYHKLLPLLLLANLYKLLSFTNRLLHYSSSSNRSSSFSRLRKLAVMRSFRVISWLVDTRTITNKRYYLSSMLVDHFLLLSRVSLYTHHHRCGSIHRLFLQQHWSSLLLEEEVLRLQPHQIIKR